MNVFRVYIYSLRKEMGAGNEVPPMSQEATTTHPTTHLLPESVSDHTVTLTVKGK